MTFAIIRSANLFFTVTNFSTIRSSLIERSLVDHFVPFLPMEKHHVRQCAKAEGKDRYKLH